MKQPEVILDFGSSKVVCMVGSCSEQGRFEIYGIGVSEHKGLKKKRFLDEPGLRLAVQNAIDAAQSEARRKIRSVHVGVPGPFLRVECSQYELTLGEEPREVAAEDIDRLMEAAITAQIVPEGYERALSVPFYYRVDGSPRSVMPLGVTGRTLWASVSNLYIDSGFESFVRDMLGEIGVEAASFMDAASAGANMLIPEKDRHEEAVAVDVGYYHTDVLLMRNSACIYRTVLPVGGAHIASDISYVLQISPSVAESIKRRHAFALDYAGQTGTHRLTDGTMETIVYEDIQDIIEARANEMGAMVGEAIRKSPAKISPDTIVYLSGGGLAMMRGSREMFQAACGFCTVTELPWMPRNRTENFASTYGMLDYVCHSELGAEKKDSWKDNRVIQFLINFFTK